MKILVSCYACTPYKGSEPGMGWKFVNSLSKYHELYVITETKFKPDLERYFSEHPENQSSFHFFFIQKDRHKKLRKIWPPSYYWFYRKWQKKAYELAKRLDSKENFDVIHQLSMTGFREPGYLWKLNKPLVWGPIGGMHQSPWKLLPYIGLYGMVYYGFRNLLNLKDIYLKRLPRIMARHSSAIIAATQDAQTVVREVWKRDAVLIPEAGLSTDSDSFVESTNRGDYLRIVWSGQHTPSKALNLLLDALAECKNKERMVLHVLGQGKYTQRWQKRAVQNNLEQVVWYGWIEKEKAIDVMRSCDVLCITSMADLTSAVLLEGLSYGLPVIAMNLFGFANTITDKCGIKIDVHSKKQVVRDFAKALDMLCENEKLRKSLSKGAIERVKEYSWEKKAQQIDEIYQQVVRK